MGKGFINAWPVIEREIRLESRKPANHVLRATSIGLGITSLALIPIQLGIPPSQMGYSLFSMINALVFLLIWILCPLMTSDAIAREKREGTLGLLLLTDLSPLSIALGKITLHLIRSLTLILVFIPLYTLTFLWGGVTTKDIVASLLINTASVFLALSAGMLASSLSKSLVKAWITAALLAILLCFQFLQFNSRSLTAVTRFRISPSGTQTSETFWANPTWHLEKVVWILSNKEDPYQNHEAGILAKWIPFLSLNTGLSFENLPGIRAFNRSGIYYSQTWNWIWSQTPTLQSIQWLILLFDALIISIGICFLVLLLTARAVKMAWKEEPPPPWLKWIQNTFCSPLVWKQFLRGRMNRSLDRNPVGWLQEFRWSTRISKWGWCLFLVMAELVVTTATLDPRFSQQYMALLLMGGMVLASAISFQRELESGAMELILVTPISEARVITGRLRGLYNQFLPAMALIFGIEVFLKTQVYSRHSPGNFQFMMLLISCYFFIPVIGIYWSMQKRPKIQLFLRAFFWALIIPAGLGPVCNYLLQWFFSMRFGPYTMAFDFFWTFVIFQGVLAWVFYKKLLKFLESRSFLSA